MLHPMSLGSSRTQLDENSRQRSGAQPHRIYKPYYGQNTRGDEGMKKILYAAGSMVLCAGMAMAQTATTTQSGNGNVTGTPSGTATTQTTKDTVVTPKKKVVHTKKNTVKGGGQKMAAAPSDLG